MKVSRDTVDEFRGFFDDNAEEITELINLARNRLGDVFGEDVDVVTEDDVRREFSETLQDDDLALNLAALYKIGVELEVRNDYAGFVVDELIGRRIAGSIAGSDPQQTLAEATFHYIDVHTGEVLEEGVAGYDDVVAGVAAGIQTRLPGWNWQKEGF